MHSSFATKRIHYSLEQLNNVEFINIFLVIECKHIVYRFHYIKKSKSIL